MLKLDIGGLELEIIDCVLISLVRKSSYTLFVTVKTYIAKNKRHQNISVAASSRIVDLYCQRF